MIKTIILTNKKIIFLFFILFILLFGYILLNKINPSDEEKNITVTESNNIGNDTNTDRLFKDYVVATLDGNFSVKLDIPSGKILKTEIWPNFDYMYKTGSFLRPDERMEFRRIDDGTKKDYILLFKNGNKLLDEKALYIKKTIKESGCDIYASECPIQTYTDVGYYCVHPHSIAGYFSCTKTDIIEKANKASPDTAWVLWDENKNILYGYSFANFTAFPFSIYPNPNNQDPTTLSSDFSIEKKLIEYNYKTEKLTIIEPSKNLLGDKKEFSTPELSTNKSFVTFINVNRIILLPLNEQNKECIIDTPTTDDISIGKKLWTADDKNLIVNLKNSIYIIDTTNCKLNAYNSSKTIKSATLSKSNKYFVYITEDSFSRNNQNVKHSEVYIGEVENPKNPIRKIFEIYSTGSYQTLIDFSSKVSNDNLD